MATAIAVLAGSSEVPLQRVCEHLQQKIDMKPFRYDGHSQWNWGETSSFALHLNVTRDDSLTLRKDWVEAPAGTNYLITLSCGKADYPHLLPCLQQELETVLGAKVHALESHRLVREAGERDRERAERGREKYLLLQEEQQSSETACGIPLSFSWVLFIGLVIGLFFVLRACSA